VLGLVLTFGLWAIEQRRGDRWYGIGANHRCYRLLRRIPGALMRAPRGDEGVVVFATMAALLAALVVVFWAAYRVYIHGQTGGLVRALAVLGMVAAMIQGLLGGIRVRYNDLFGREMSASTVLRANRFALLIAVAVLTAARDA